jgi:hypothetical protein
MEYTSVFRFGQGGKGKGKVKELKSEGVKKKMKELKNEEMKEWKIIK